MNERRPRWLWWVLSGCLALLFCISCLAIAATIGLMLYEESETVSGPLPTGTVPELSRATPLPSPTSPPIPPTALPTRLLQPTQAPTASATAAPPTPLVDAPAEIRQQPVTMQEWESLEALLHADYPVHDMYEAAVRLGRYDVGPRTVQGTPYQEGDRRTFVTDGGEIEALLVAVTDHTYFWMEDGLDIDVAAIRMAAETFEDEYYPRLVALFGQEWQPGIDNDPRFSVLHLASVEDADDELGYFYSGDEYPRALSSDSNEQELLYLYAEAVTPGSDLYYGTLVHEFQHLVQWYVDGNETRWLDEGLSQLAELYVGLDTAETVDYLRAPATPLNRWHDDDDRVYAHYAASYLFTVYLWEQLGDDAVRELVRHPANGLGAVNAVLAGYRPETTLVDFLGAWSVANYLDDPAAGPAYTYEKLELRQAATETGIKYAPYELLRTVPQFGVHYVDVALSGPVTLTFAGDTATPLLPVPPHSGNTMWYAPAQENLSSHLTREFDLSEVETATLRFWSWYDLRFDSDAAYLTLSDDGGRTWRLLSLRHGNAGEYGPALSGRSSDRPGAGKGGWVEEVVSLDDYVGQSVLIRFELLTYGESAVHGFAVDDISVAELDYKSDVESVEPEWQAEGFVRSGQWLPQQWAVHYIRTGERPEVERLLLDELNQGVWRLDLGPEGGTVVTTALTPFVYQDATYWLTVTR